MLKLIARAAGDAQKAGGISFWPTAGAVLLGTEKIAELIIGGFCRNVVAIPPAAAQRLKQGGRIGVAVGLRQNEVQHRLLIGLFGAQERQVVGIAG